MQLLPTTRNMTR